MKLTHTFELARVLCVFSSIGVTLNAQAITFHQSTATMNASVSGGMPLSDTMDSMSEHNVYNDAALRFLQYTNYLGDNRSFLSHYLWMDPAYAGYSHIRHIAVGISWIYRNDINGDNQEPRDTTYHRFQLSSRTETVFTWNGGQVVGIVGTDPWTIWHERKLERGTLLGGVFIPTGIEIVLPLDVSSTVLGAGTYRFVVDLSYDQTDNANWYRGMGANITLHEVSAPPNQPPVATDDYYVMEQSGMLFEAAPGNMVNDADPDEDELTVDLVEGPSTAESFNLNADGSFSYKPTAYFFGTDTYTYRVFDGTEYSAPATVHISVQQPGANGHLTGGGNFFQSGTKRTFGFQAKVKNNGSVQGNIEFQDHALGLNVKSTSVSWVHSPNSQDGFFSGACKVNGQTGFTFFVEVHDRGEPGINDSFSIWVFDSSNALVYSSEGDLTSGGNIQVH